MKLSNPCLCLIVLTFGTFPLWGQDEVVSGNLAVEGDLDVQGGVLSLGTRADLPASSGVDLLYVDGEGPSMYFGAGREEASWYWQSGGSTQMSLDGDNRWRLFDSSVPAMTKVLLDPSGESKFFGSVRFEGAVTFAGLVSGAGGISGGNAVFGGSVASQQVRIDTQGRMGIGVEAPVEKVDIRGNARMNGRLSIMTNGGYATLPNTYLQVGVNGGPSLPFHNQIYGIDTRPTNSGTGGAIGVSANPIQSRLPVEPAGDLIAFSGQVRSAGGIVQEGIVLRAKSPNVTANGSQIHTAYGVYIDRQEAFGVGQGYGVYQLADVDVNYFAGAIGVGTTSPSDKLDVHGNATVRGVLRLPPSGDLSMGSFTAGSNPAAP